MSLDNSAEIIAFTKQEGRRENQPEKAGRRIFAERPLRTKTPVKEGVINNLNFCEQDLNEGNEASIRWQQYLRDGVKVTGGLTVDKSLDWFPSKGELLKTEDLLNSVMELHPRLPVLATFRFGEKPTTSPHAAEIEITATEAQYEVYAQDLADYFVRSVGESEAHLITLKINGQKDPVFSGSLHEYFRFYKK